MIELGVIDLSAEGRRRVAALIEKWSWVSPDSRAAVPHCSVSLLSPEEVRFNGSFDVYVVGPDLIGCDAAFLATIRRQIPNKILLCVLDARTYSFSVIEQLGRLGVDDVLMESATSDEFFRRLILLERRMRSKSRGVLSVVSGARGGVGVTFVAAAMVESLASKGRKVCVVDCDILSQDLTRSLKVSPHVSEGLRLFLDQQRVVTSESALECAQQIWSDEHACYCVPPPSSGDLTVYTTPKAARVIKSFLDALLLHFDDVIVDSSSLPATALNALYQGAERVVFVANRDPAGAFANRQALTVISGYLGPEATIAIVLNDNSVASASTSLLLREVLVAPGRDPRRILLPRSVRAARWPCSGSTPFKFLVRPFEALTSKPDAQVLHDSPEWKAALWRRLIGVFKLRAQAGEIRSGRKRGASVDALEGSVSARGGERYPMLLGQAPPPVDEGQLVSKPMLVT
jgi:MinD-like ATPase involved in chromosome partitioning or flagellar assembly